MSEHQPDDPWEGVTTSKEVACIPERKPYEDYPSFDDFGGLNQEIDQLRESYVLSQHPELCEQWDIQKPHGVLLCGPGGVGKTELVKALARETESELMTISVSDILTKWVGEPTIKLKQTFLEAGAKEGPVILFFDEFDGLFGVEASGNSGVAASLIAEMKTRMTSVETDQPNTTVVAATNSLSGFDEALMRPGRFDTVIQIPKPNEAARSNIFGKYIDRKPELYDLGDFEKHGSIDIGSLSAATDGMTGADIRSILQAARTKRVMAHLLNQQELTPITQNDILKVLQLHKRQRLSSTE